VVTVWLQVGYVMQVFMNMETEMSHMLDVCQRVLRLLQRYYYGDEDPLAEVNYRVQRAVRAEMVAEAARQLAARPRSPRPVRALHAHLLPTRT